MMIKSQKGTALLTALFIMALVAITAMAITLRVKLDIYRTGLTEEAEKLYLASQAVVFWAMDDMKNPNRHYYQVNADDSVAIFPQKLANIYPGVMLDGAVFDLQSKYNINNLLDNKQVQPFLLLLNVIKPDMSKNDKMSLIDNIRFFIQPQNPNAGLDNHLQYYLKQQPAYLPAFQPLASVSELRMIEGVSIDVYQLLSQFVHVLPDVTPINILTADKITLQSLGNGLSSLQADELINMRMIEDIDKVPMLVNEITTKFAIPKEQITTDSQYYLVVARAHIRNNTMVNYSIIKRVLTPKKPVQLMIVNETLNSQ